MLKNRVQIGTATTDKDMTDIQRSEVARWYTERKLPAGILPLMAEVSTTGFRLYAQFDDAVIVGQNSQSLFGGVPYGEDPGKKDVGKVSGISIFVPAKEQVTLSNYGVDDVVVTNTVKASWISVKDGEIAFDSGHADYLALVNSESLKEVNAVLSDNHYVPDSVKLRMDKTEWNEVVHELVMDGYAAKEILESKSSGHDTSHTKRKLAGKFVSAFLVDDLLRSKTGVGVIGNGLDYDQVSKLYDSQCGNTANFPAQVVKALLDEGKIKMLATNSKEKTI